MESIGKHSKFFQALLQVPTRALPSVFQHCNSEYVRALIEIIYNIRKFGYTEREKKKLSRYSGVCKQLLCSVGKNTKKVSIGKGRRVLTNNSKQIGGFLPLLLVPLLAKAALAGAVSAGTGLAIKAIHKKATK